MDDIDDAFGFAIVAVIISVARSAGIPALLLDMVPQVPFLHETFEVSLKGLAVLGSMPILLVVSTELALIPGGRVTFHRLRPLEEGLRLDLAEELVDRLLEDRVHSFVGGGFAFELPASPRGHCRGGRGPVPI